MKELILVCQTLVDIDLFTDIRRIEAALKRHSCTEALTWCSENKSGLRRIKVGILIIYLIIHVLCSS